MLLHHKKIGYTYKWYYSINGYNITRIYLRKIDPSTKNQKYHTYTDGRRNSRSKQRKGKKGSESTKMGNHVDQKEFTL